MDKGLRDCLNIRYVRLHFTAVMLADTRLPADKVSALRGAMGEMLMRANCVRDRHCDTCDFEADCIVRRTMYTKSEITPRFVTTSDSVGYLLECENREEEFCGGDALQFALVLFGKTIAYFNQYMQAFFAAGNAGIGKEHARFQIVSVTNSRNEPLLLDGAVYMKRYIVQTLDEYVDYRIGRLKKSGMQNRLVFHTPVTLKRDGTFLEEFEMEAVWNAVLRRIYMLECFEGIEGTVYASEAGNVRWLPRIVEQRARLTGIRRYSSTQERTVVLRGLKGFAQLDAIRDDMLPLLLAGELTHIGKNTSFGFGRYSVV